MILDPELTKILISTVEAPLDESRWVDIADAMADRHDGHFVFYTLDMSRAAKGRLWLSEGFNKCADLAEKFTENESPEEVAANKRIALAAPFRLLTELDAFAVESDDDLPRMPFRDALQERLGTGCRIGAKLNDLGPWLDVGSLHISGRNISIPESIRQELAMLFPVFGKAIETGRIISNLVGRYGALFDLFDRLAFGAAFLDDDDRIVLANESLKSMARDGDALRIDGAKRLVSPQGDRSAISEICFAARQIDSSVGSSLALLTRRSGNASIIAKAAKVQSQYVRSTPLVLVLFLDPEVEYPIDLSGVSALGQLTNAEQDVCRLLVEGLGTEAIADRRETAIATTQTQLKTAQAKLGCRSRLDLLRLVLATAPPIHAPHTPNGV